MVEIIGCSTAHPRSVMVTPSNRCVEDGCQRPARAKGRCPMHYQRWRRTSLQVRPAERVCPWCGPYLSADTPVCPTCDMTPGEHAYRAEILKDSAAVFVREWREFQQKRRLAK